MRNVLCPQSTGVVDANSGIPSQTTTEVSTRMIVYDGQTVFVGGLIKNTVDESQQGVPILGKIPGIGRLFSNRQKSDLRTETIVLITPTIIDTSIETMNTNDSDTRRFERHINSELEIN